jgi:hypothetical protein
MPCHAERTALQLLKQTCEQASSECEASAPASGQLLAPDPDCPVHKCPSRQHDRVRAKAHAKVCLEARNVIVRAKFEVDCHALAQVEVLSSFQHLAHFLAVLYLVCLSAQRPYRRALHCHKLT